MPKERRRVERAHQGVPMSEIIAFTRLAAKLRKVKVKEVQSVDATVVAREMLAQDDREAAARLAVALTPKKRGRPREAQKHLRIMASIEAYCGAGLTRTQAITRAADKWCLQGDHMEDIYKANKLAKEYSRLVRDFFKGEAVCDIDEYIKQLLEAGRRTHRASE
jgi:hypothetical protein